VLVADGVTIKVPESASLPDQAPEATQDVAWVDDHDRVLLPPANTEAALAANVTVGG
jgi:hypothetical protein